jgi:signal transduction histidine kinase
VQFPDRLPVPRLPVLRLPAARLTRVWPAAVLGRVGLAALFAATVAADCLRVAAEGGGWPLTLAAGALVCGLALVRQRNLAVTALAGLAVWGLAAAVAARWSLPAQPVLGPVIGLAVLGAAAVRQLPAARAVVVAVTGAAVVAAGRAADSPGAAEAQALIGLLAWTGVVAAGLWLRYQDEQRRAAIDAVRRDVRLDLARELHDVVAHHITGLVVQTQAARLTAGQRPDTVDPALARVETAGAAALAALRRVVGLLRDAGDTSSVRPGPGELAELVGRFAGHGPPVDLRLPSGPPDPDWPPELSTTVYRVVQESLTNAMRHAAAASLVTVTVRHDPRQVTVEVTDDAPAAALAPAGWAGGYGLVGMRERVEALGGSLSAGDRPPGPGPEVLAGPEGPAGPECPAGDGHDGQVRDGWAVLATLPLPGQSVSVSGQSARGQAVP